MPASDLRTRGILNRGGGHSRVRPPLARPSPLPTSSHNSSSLEIFLKYRILRLHSSVAPGSPSAPVDTSFSFSAQLREETYSHWVGDTELNGPVSSCLWRRARKWLQLGAESPPPLAEFSGAEACPQPPPHPRFIDEVPTPRASFGDCIWK